MRVFLLLLGFLGGAFSLVAPAQTAEYEARLERGRAALEQGDLVAARRHLLEAWPFAPADGELAALLVEASRDRPPERELWARHALLRDLDRKGHPRSSRAVRVREEELVPLAAESAAARVRAVDELLDLARRRDKRAARESGAALVSYWARSRAARLARDLPGCAEVGAPRALVLPRKLPGEVVSSLERAHSTALAQGRTVDAVRAARILSGLAAQGAFKDLQGPPPKGLARLAKVAGEALAKARARLETELGEPLSLEELLDMDEEAARAFTRRHADLADPGLALTPEGHYRVETSCGWETLVGVVETLDAHHARLASWYGEDPFAERLGLVRVVPEAAGLEAEGAPFWWAGGFQGGDTTVVRFSCGTIEGLGHTLVHELTHRFDGALFPGQPAWLSEGKAVWTAGSYGSATDEDFVARHVDFGTVEAAWLKGYGAPRKLRELITGELEEYRDNYVAGYALYVYLALGSASGAPDYSERLREFMRGGSRSVKDRLGWFERCFLDGEAGRPETLEAFAAGFEAFGRGFYWDDRAPWTERYEEEVLQASGPWVYDEPTWVWSRNRAEPVWGQDQAWRAARLFLDLGQARDAARAFVWAAAVDERSPARDGLFAPVFEELGQEEAAWVLARVAGARIGSPPPRLPANEALDAALAAEARGHQEAGRTLAAHCARAERSAFGLEGGEVDSVLSSGRDIDPPADRLGGEGWTEDGLTGFEERRAAGCWYVEEDGDLHVGRFRPRESSGVLDRAAHNRHAFAHTERWEPPGRYLIRARVQFTTSYVSAALILGRTRRDRYLRLDLSAGDFYYSIGKKEQPDELESVSWRLRGLRDRDGPLGGSQPGGRVEFDAPRTSFELEALVDGGAVHVWIEGRHVGSYNTVDGAEIEGTVGFATSTGAIRVSDPRVRRLDRQAALGLACSPRENGGAAVGELDLRRPTHGAFTDLLNQRVRPLAPAPSGSLLVWTPLDAAEDPELDACAARAAELAERALEILAREDAPLPIELCVPASLGEERLTTLSASLDPRIHLAPYAWAPENAEDLAEAPGASKAWLGFVDAAGVLRVLTRFYGFTDSLDEPMRHWVRVFRDHRGP